MNLTMMAFQPHCDLVRNHHDDFLSSLYMDTFSIGGKPSLSNPSISPNIWNSDCRQSEEGVNYCEMREEKNAFLY